MIKNKTVLITNFSDPAFGRVPASGLALKRLSDRKARLPYVQGGTGHFSAQLISPLAFYAAYSQHASLDKGTRTRLLLTELQDTVRRVRTLIPADAADEHVVDAADVGLKRPIRKLQRELTRAAHGQAKRALLDSLPDSTEFGARDLRALEHRTDQWLPTHVCPTEDTLHIKADHYTAGVRAYLLMPQLLRRTVAPVWLDQRADGQPDFSYQADPCRHCTAKACDRHLIHAHACIKSSNQNFETGTRW